VFYLLIVAIFMRLVALHKMPVVFCISFTRMQHKYLWQFLVKSKTLLFCFWLGYCEIVVVVVCRWFKPTYEGHLL